MDNQEEQNIEVQSDPYLESPKAFHLEMPLYHVFDLAIGVDAEKVYKLLSYSGTIDAYCIWCDKESVFDTQEHVYSSTTYWEWKNSADFRRNRYRCSRNSNHEYFIYYLKTKDSLLKIGQWPSVADFQIPQAEKYRKILGEEEYKEFTRGIGLAAHGVGIGSFVYLRRVFENLIEEAHSKAQAENKEFPNNEYLKARMDEKIKMVKDYLPEFLVENRSLYAILSTGIHDLTEDECLQYFETVKIGIEQILDEKIIQKEKADKAIKAREAIQKAHGKLTNS
ncbi:MAG: short-chain dehydrogenase [Patescibacteria group bacterium]